LRRFTRGRTTFPTLAEFDAAGRTDLRSAVTDYGGVRYWATRLGLDLPAHRHHTTYSIDDALEDARSVVARLGYLPGEPTLRRLGMNRLATVVRASGGARKFAEQYNL
jgi:hypothetical protein